MIEITLQVFWLTEEDMALEHIGVDVPIEKCATKEDTLYRIDWIRPYKDSYCEVSSGPDIFLVNMSYEKVRQFIKDQMTFKFN